MVRVVRSGLFVALLASALWPRLASPQTALSCGPFTPAPAAAPASREAAAPASRFEQIKAAVKTTHYRMLFLGDSITERYDQEVWRRDMAPRGVLNAGVSGDRTEHLLWRLQHGNLDGPAPAGVIVMIGTNDLTNGGRPRPPELIAEGIRADLLYLRQRLPAARILLLGLYPRADAPRLVHGPAAVNRLIAACGDDRAVVYADIGGLLLDHGELTQAVSPDRLHFSRLGYERLAPRLNRLIDALVAGR